MSYKSLSHILVFDKEKGKATKIKIVGFPKNQRLTHQSEILKVSGINLTMRCIDSKRSNDMLNMEPNEKFQRYCTQVCMGGHTCIFL